MSRELGHDTQLKTPKKRPHKEEDTSVKSKSKKKRLTEEVQDAPLSPKSKQREKEKTKSKDKAKSKPKSKSQPQAHASPPPRLGESSVSTVLVPDSQPIRPSSCSSSPNDSNSPIPFRPKLIGPSGLHLVTATLYVPIAPITFNKPLAGTIASALSPLLLTYYAPLRGVMLAHRNARFVCDAREADSSASSGGTNGLATSKHVEGGPRDQEDQPLANVRDEAAAAFAWLRADILVFRPERGVVLDGRIVLQSEGHLGLVVWNYFSASIERQRLPAGWKWVEEADGVTRKWALKDSETRAEENTEQIGTDTRAGHYVDAAGRVVEGTLTFKVNDFERAATLEEEKTVISIKGTLLGDAEENELKERERRKSGKRQGRTTPGAENPSLPRS